MRKQSLVTQILTVNALLISATTFAAIIAARLSVIGENDTTEQALIVLAGIFAVLLVNGFVLRRRFAGLERLIELMEDIDLSRPGLRADVATADTLDVSRLCQAFNRMLERVESERARTGSAVLTAQEQERTRLARDLHDECNQALTGILLRLEAVAHDARPAVRNEIETIKGLTSVAMEELLGLARELRPSALDDHGLRVALQAQIERFASTTGIAAQMSVEGGAAPVLETLTEQEQIVVYRIVQEALSNVIRHADATSVDLGITIDGVGRPTITIRDDGRGLPEQRSEGLGLVGMRERARLAGGHVVIEPHRRGGTEIALTLQGSSREALRRPAA